MVNAQEWLDQNYPKENRSKIKEIYLNEPSLEEELDLEDFTYEYLKVYISPQVDETKLNFKNLPKSVYVIPLVAQKYINYHYPNKESREKVTKLHIWDKNLEGDLDLSDFTNLEELNCTNNLLTSIILPKNSVNLKTLNLVGNNFSPQDLSFLVETTNLEILVLGNHDWEIVTRNKQGIYNKFMGSLDYLSNMKKLKFLSIDDTDFNKVDIENLPKSLEEINYCGKRPNCKLTEIISQLKEFEWKDLHLDFNLKKRREWEKADFNKKEVREWIEVGIEPKDYNFANWLRNIKKLTFQWVLKNKNSSNYEELREKCNNFGWCEQCQQPNTSKNWCHSCAEKDWQKDLEQSSGQKLIEKFIQNQQLRKSDKGEEFKWISYEQFMDIKYLAEGGFSKIYKAKYEMEEWEKNFHIYPFEEKKVKKIKTIVLKSLTNSQNISLDLLREISNVKLVDSSSGIVKCYGISQDPETKNYIIVMQYVEDGNLRQFLRKNFRKLSWEDKVTKLFRIAEGLSIIHKKGLVHCDFHMGNILSTSETTLITDLGLSKPNNLQLKEGQIFGVLPYIAPELLSKKENEPAPYTQKSDIYSFGIVAYEFLTNAYPYPKMNDLDLALNVCQGYRPNIEKTPIPSSLKDLIKKCWNSDPLKRPLSIEISNILWEFFGSSDFPIQVREINQKPQEEIRSFEYKIHPTAITTSKLINTKQISEKLNKFSQSVKFDSEEFNRFLKKEQESQNTESKDVNNNNFSQSIEFNTSELNQVNWEELEQPTADWVKIHPSFTLELIQSWQNLNFTYNQTRDWVNTNSPTQQDQAIQEPKYYAWLRDEVKITPKQLVNELSQEEIKELREHFQEYQQQKLQTQIQQPPK